MALEGLQNYFRTRPNQYMKDTLQRLYRANPMRALIDHSEYDGSDGPNPTIIEDTHELPESYPKKVSSHTDGLDNLGMEAIPRTQHPANYEGEDSADTDDPNPLLKGAPENSVTSPSDVAAGTSLGSTGYPDAHEIRRGQLERTFEIRQISFNTSDIALDDIKTAHRAAQVAAAWGRGLTEFTRVFMSDFLRVQNVGMITNKYIPTGATAGTLEEDDYTEDFSNVTLNPTPAQLEWWHLEELYWDLVARGVADEMAVGQANGQPILPLVISPKVKNYLWRDEATNAETFKWHDPQSRLAQLGYPKAIKGFIPIVDVFPIRMADAAACAAGTFTYPTQNVTTSFGYKHKPRAAWKSANIEVATILPREVYSCKYEPSSPTAFDDVEFDPQNYVGEFRFINNKTYKGHNDRGNCGYFLADIRVGAMPKYPDLGVTIAHDISGL